MEPVPNTNTKLPSPGCMVRGHERQERRSTYNSGVHQVKFEESIKCSAILCSLLSISEAYSDSLCSLATAAPHKMPLGIIQSKSKHAPGTILLFDHEFQNESRVFKRGFGKVYLALKTVQLARFLIVNRMPTLSFRHSRQIAQMTLS